MGQKASTDREFTPDTKPPKKEKEINARESLKAIQKRLGVNVVSKGTKMPMKTESFIVDAIVIEKLKHSGNFNEIAKAIKQKLDDQYGGWWNVLIAKEWNLAESSFAISSYNSIQLTYESNHYTVFRSK